MKATKLLALPAAALLCVGCWGSRYVSADKDLEDIYRGRSFYEVEDDFGRPDATVDDGMHGTTAIYHDVSLNGTRAGQMYTDFVMRNRATHEEGMPVGDISFSFNAKMRCYAVESDFQHRRVRQPKPAKVSPSRDPNRPVWETPRVPRTLEFPTVERRSPEAEVVSIEKIEVGKESVKVYFRYRSRTPKHRPIPDRGITLGDAVYIEDDETGERYPMLQVEGISLYPEYTQFAFNEGGYDVLNYTITFAPIDRETTRINIVEPGFAGHNFYGVDVKTPLRPRID